MDTSGTRKELFFFIHRLSSREKTVKKFHWQNTRSQVFEAFFLHIKCSPVFIAIFVPRAYSVNYCYKRRNVLFLFINSFLKYIPAFYIPLYFKLRNNYTRIIRLVFVVKYLLNAMENYFIDIIEFNM